MHKKALHLQASANVDRTISSRKQRTCQEKHSSEFRKNDDASEDDANNFARASAHVDRTISGRKQRTFQGKQSSEFLEKDESEAAEFVQSLYQQILSECSFVSLENLAEVPRFSKNEVCEGLTLGKGNFCTINAVKGFALIISKERRQTMDTFLHGSGPNSMDESIHHQAFKSRDFIAKHCHRRNGDARYAVKRVQRKKTNDHLTYSQGKLDLANEALFLGTIEHPNIIKLRGIAQAEIMSKDCFLILDRLYDTLAKRRLKWKNEEKKLMGLKRIFCKKCIMLRKSMLLDRLSFAADLASALSYLHRNGCLHRDLKPENIGFDVRGDIKIFDFGLARELPKKTKASDRTFHLTKHAGTPRYMAPEVAIGRYNEACDIYSVGLILWEFITLKRPFQDQTCLEDFEKNVWSLSGPLCRPTIPK